MAQQRLHEKSITTAVPTEIEDEPLDVVVVDVGKGPVAEAGEGERTSGGYPPLRGYSFSSVPVDQQEHLQLCDLILKLGRVCHVATVPLLTSTTVNCATLDRKRTIPLLSAYLD